MRLSEKIARLGSRRAWRSARQAIGRLLHPLPARHVYEKIDRARLAEIAHRHGVPGEHRHPPKYVDVERFVPMNIRRVQDLGLTSTRGRPLNILDLGSGGGYFLFVSKLLGHRTLGLDLDDFPLYTELFDLFGLERVIGKVEPFRPLPEAAAARGPFDLVTAFSIVFNGQRTPQLWGPNEWAFLIDDLRRRFLAPGGRIFFDLNPELDGQFFTPELLSFFRQAGAQIDRSKVLLTSGARG